MQISWSLASGWHKSIMETYHSLLFVLAYKKNINSGHALGAVSNFKGRVDKTLFSTVQITGKDIDELSLTAINSSYPHFKNYF